MQSGIALALSCGYPSAEYGTAYGDSNSGDIINAEKWAATQAVIWDLICEYRSPYTYASWGTSPFYGCVDTSQYPTFALWYDGIVSAMQSAADIPSFAATLSRWCDTIELKKDASGSYTGTGLDPVKAYIKIKATVVAEKGSLTIQKTDADTGAALSGVTYRLFDANGAPLAGAELRLEEMEFDLISRARRGECLFRCGSERYMLQVHAPAYKEKLFGTAGGR